MHTPIEPCYTNCKISVKFFNPLYGERNNKLNLLRRIQNDDCFKKELRVNIWHYIKCTERVIALKRLIFWVWQDLP